VRRFETVSEAKTPLSLLLLNRGIAYTAVMSILSSITSFVNSIFGSTEAKSEPDGPEPKVTTEKEGEFDRSETDTDSESVIKGIDETDSSLSEEHPDDSMEGTTDSVEAITGIGPAYADRLADVGVETTDELAESDAESLGEAIDVSPKRVTDWIERAQQTEL
jgi:predicted flap endonuclease-1-like 5' DNA nuclease